MWRRLGRLTWKEQCLLVEAMFALIGARLVLTCLPFRSIVARLGTVGLESAFLVSSQQNETARKIGWSIQAVGRRVPWARQCLAQALAGHWMIRRRNIPATLYLGVSKDSAKPFAAHAWLRCGPVWVTGGRERESFKELTRIASTEL